MKRAVWVVVLTIAVCATLYWRALTAPSVRAQSDCAVPKSYGPLKATGLNGADAVFEAPDGTVRFVDRQSCSVDATMTRK